MTEPKLTPYGNLINPNGLKYGLCSYFALAYHEKHPDHKLIAIMESDTCTKRDYLVHVVLETPNHTFVDAENTYDKLSDTTKEIIDIEHMDLHHKCQTRQQIIDQIEHDIFFEEDLYQAIRTYVQQHY